jgi:hypothetical protein
MQADRSEVVWAGSALRTEVIEWTIQSTMIEFMERESCSLAGRPCHIV